MKHLAAFLLLLPVCVLAQVSPHSFGFSAFAAENGVAQQDAFSVWNNPAMMRADSVLVGISAQNIFLTEGLYHFTGSAQVNTNVGRVGIGVNRFGDDLMNETTVVAGINRQLFEEIYLGVNLHYFTTNALFAESAATVYPQVGLAYRLSNELEIGFSARNPLSQDLNQPFDQNLQAFYSFGFQYYPSQEFSTTIQADVLEDEGLSAGLGVSYLVFDQFTFLIGGKTSPEFLTMGCSFSLEDFKIGIGGKQQSPLGISPLFVAESAF